MVKETKMNPIEIFLRFLKVGIIGFGGGSALIPVIEKEIVGEGKPMQEADYLKHTVIANITPGALPVKLGATCGYQLGGVAGGIAGAYGAMLPGVLITLLIMALFSLMGEQAIALFNFASVGISVFIVMLLVSYTLKTCGKDKLYWALCAVSFLLTCGKEVHHLAAQVFSLASAQLPAPLFDIATIDLMIITFVLITFSIVKLRRAECGVVGALALLYCFFRGKTGANAGAAYAVLAVLLLYLAVKLLRGRQARAQKRAPVSVKASALIAIAILLLLPVVLMLASSVVCGEVPAALLGNVALSTVTSFGGGEAYVSVADGFFVQSAYVSSETFYTQLVPVANALPGPILVKIASGIGFLFGEERFGASAAWMLGITAATLAVGVCCSVALLIMQVFEAVEHSAFIKNLKRYILPVICGMLLSTSCSMLSEATKITMERGLPAAPTLLVMLCAVALLRFLHKKFHVHDLILLLGSAVLSLAVLLLI